MIKALSSFLLKNNNLKSFHKMELEASYSDGLSGLFSQGHQGNPQSQAS